MRNVVSGLLVLLACIATAAAVPIRWADSQLHSAAYADTMRSLPQDSQVHRALVGLITNGLESSGQQVPPGVMSIITAQVPVVLNTPEATQVWVDATLLVRDQLLSGRGGEVAIDVSELVQPLRERLRAQSIPLPPLPKEYTRVVVMNDQSVAQAREAARFIDDTAPWIWIPPAILLALALLVSKHRWVTLAAVGIGTALAALVAIYALGAARDQYVAGIAEGPTQALALAIYQSFANSLRTNLLTLLTVASVVALIGLVLAVAMKVIRRSNGSAAT
ncbi:hypothetical protein [Actinopolymorpha alba]|uniref:hypothetical protein n=1 Tax=Actinopolymorpha alba TaxID=533267 RepID=UPI00036EB646|nr:hypothetical protein [Actinopolymorpha alba]